MTAKRTGAVVVKPPPAARFAAKKDRHAGLVRAAARRREYHRDERIDGIIREAYRRLVEEKDRNATKLGAAGKWLAGPHGEAPGGRTGAWRVSKNRSGLQRSC
jgi:hypothetical protein